MEKTAIQDLSRRLYFVTTVTFEGNGGKDCDPRSQLKIEFCATATAQETENFVSAVTSGATAIQDLGQRLNFVTTVTIEGNIGKVCGTIEFGDHSHNWRKLEGDCDSRSQSRVTTCDDYHNLRKF